MTPSSAEPRRLPFEVAVLNEAHAHVVVAWIASAEELALVAGPTLSWPLTPQNLIATSEETGRSTTVLLSQGAPVAFGAVSRVDDAARIGWVVVDPKLRGQGWGRQVMTVLIDQARRIPDTSRVTLGVFVHNENARSLYRSLGFVEGPPKPVTFGDLPWQVIEMELAQG